MFIHHLSFPMDFSEGLTVGSIETWLIKTATVPTVFTDILPSKSRCFNGN